MPQFPGAISDESSTSTADRAIASRVLSHVIGSIYDCALDPSRWERTLAEITQAMTCESAILSLNDLRENNLLIEKSAGWGQVGFEQRKKHLPEIHARLKEWFGRSPSLDEPYVASRELSAEYLGRSPYVQQCLKPLGIVDIMHYFLMYTPSRFSEVVLARHRRHGLITGREIEMGRLLLPHLRRAVTISNVLDARTIERARMAEALDALRCGVILTNVDGAILHANRAAEHMLRNGSAVQGTNGVLGTQSPAAARELREAIQFAARDEVALGETGLAVRLTELEAPPLFAHVLPMNGSELRTRLKPEAVAAVFIGVPDGRDAAGIMAAAYNLTPAETDVLASLLVGRSRTETAAHLGTSLATTKTHLVNIFAKTGVKRQSELVRLAAHIAPPTVTGGAKAD